jgi:hypothetical protein
MSTEQASTRMPRSLRGYAPARLEVDDVIVRMQRTAAVRASGSTSRVTRDRALETPRQAEELQSLEAAQAELAIDPQRALERLREHASRYPDGWLEQERAAFEVEALVRLGDDAAARHAFYELGRKYPRSPALTHLRNELEHRSY